MSAAAPGHVKPEAGHASGATLPVGVQKPAGTPWQPASESRRLLLEKVPPLQGLGADAPEAHHDPRLQGVQPVDPARG